MSGLLGKHIIFHIVILRCVTQHTVLLGKHVVFHVACDITTSHTAHSIFFTVIIEHAVFHIVVLRRLTQRVVFHVVILRCLTQRALCIRSRHMTTYTYFAQINFETFGIPYRRARSGGGVSMVTLSTELLLSLTIDTTYYCT